MINSYSLTKKTIIFSIITTFMIFIISLALFGILNNSAPFLNSGAMIAFILFAFISGLFTFGSRGVYPFALTLTPKKIGKDRVNNILRVLIFSACTILVFSLAGLLFSNIGSFISGRLFNFEKLVPYIYILFGVIAYLISLSELGLIGLKKVSFLKNIPNILKNSKGLFGILIFSLLVSFVDIIPSSWLLLGEATIEQDANYGLILLLSHAIGRIIPVLILSTVSQFGINGTTWLSERRDSFKKGLNTFVIILASIIIQMGLGYVITSSGVVRDSIFVNIWNNGWILLFLFVFPIWFKFFKEQSRVYGSPEKDLHAITLKIKDIEGEYRNLESVHKFDENDVAKRIKYLRNKLDELGYQSSILESSLRYGSKNSIRSKEIQAIEEKTLKLRLAFTIVFTLLVISFLSVFLLG